MGVWVVELGRGDGRPMSGRGRMGFGRKSCVRRWIGQVVPQDREDRTKPDISGHWGQAVKVCGGWRGKTRRFTPGRSLDNALSGGRYLLVKESLAGPQRRVREEPKKDSPSTLRKFVAFFWTKRRDRRRGGGWEVMDWQGVMNLEESAQNYFGRILLPRSDGARRRVWHGGERGNAGRWGQSTCPLPLFLLTAIILTDGTYDFCDL